MLIKNIFLNLQTLEKKNSSTIWIILEMHDKKWCNTRYTGVPLYPGVPRDLQRHMVNVAALRDVLPIVLSDENAPKPRIFFKIRTFHIYSCYLF